MNSESVEFVVEEADLEKRSNAGEDSNLFEQKDHIAGDDSNIFKQKDYDFKVR